MTFEAERAKTEREHIYVVEIDLDYCSLTHGSAPCTATETGDDKCYNTISSCNDLANFDNNLSPTSTKTYRFCGNRSPLPIGLEAIPSITDLSMSPAKIDIGGGLGVRSSASINFADHPSSDIDIDKYISGRTFIHSDRGSFWTKLRARNPNYQFRKLRMLSGYIVDGAYDVANFQTRYYIIDKLNVTNGRANITAKDPLKLASNKKAQAPAPSTGQLSAAINSSVTSATLKPAGVGNLEYDASGFVLIDSEVMSFTRSADVLTIVRNAKNTTAASHSVDATVQQCLEYSGATRGQLDFIVDDLLANFANIDSAFIPTAAWGSEVSTYLSGLLDGIIVKPFDVWKLLKELSEAMPHYLWWDERSQEIQLTALKAPPASANVLDMDSGLVADSVSVADKPDMRVSTVFVSFGQIDPTKKLDEIGNYTQTYVRVDTDSISKFGGSQVKEVFSRWISDTNKAAALQLAALVGRRFANIPRQINFSLDAKDSDVWAGTLREINHRDMVDFSGAPQNTMFQIVSVKESGNYNYEGVEIDYGKALTEDEGGGDPDVDLIVFGSNQQNANLRTVYDALFPTPTASTIAKFVVQSGVIMGSSATGSDSLDTGTWPAGAVISIVTSGYIVGAGGNGGGGNQNGFAGGDAINMQHDLTIDNLNIIGGGGGGGGGFWTSLTEDSGGGGAGNVIGFAGGFFSSDGTTENGGAGGTFLGGGDGGDLGAAGAAGNITAGGAAGAAIKKNGNILTYITTGTIHGTVS